MIKSQHSHIPPTLSNRFAGLSQPPNFSGPVQFLLFLLYLYNTNYIVVILDFILKLCMYVQYLYTLVYAGHYFILSRVTP